MAVSSSTNSPSTRTPTTSNNNSSPRTDSASASTTATNPSTASSATASGSPDTATTSQPAERTPASPESVAATRDVIAANDRAAERAFHNPPTTNSGPAPARGLSDPAAVAGAAPAAAPENLKRGAEGETVRDAQTLLNQTGANLDQDGKFGPKTQAAVREFQQQHGLQVDGVIGPETRGALERNAAAAPQESLRWGAQGPAVENIQNQLNRVGGYNLKPDGQLGNATYSALRDFQSRAGMPIDGIAGQATRDALNEVESGQRQLQGQPNAGASGQTGGAGNVSAPRGSSTDVPNNVAQFDSLTRAGQRNQMAHGRITVNGNTYDFRSGGGGNGNLPPGDYTVTRHLDRRSDKASMMVDGEGYSFALSNKYDPRVNATRSLLRVHPDGGGPGTIGCIGIVGNGAVQRQFRADMLAEIQRNGGSYTLQVRE